MAELLSMAMLNTEPVTTAKVQSTATSAAETAESDQSFAATLAAEVQAKSTDKSIEKTTKATQKARQNDAAEGRQTEQDTQQQITEQTAAKAKAESAQHQNNTKADSDSVQEFEPLDSETLPVQDQPAEQSHWLNLLEKAKHLQERISKAEQSDKAEPAATAQSAESDTKPQSLASDMAKAAAQAVAANSETKQTTQSATSLSESTQQDAQDKAQSSTGSQLEGKAKLDLTATALAAEQQTKEQTEPVSAEQVKKLQALLQQAQSKSAEKPVETSAQSDGKTSTTQSSGSTTPSITATSVSQTVVAGQAVALSASSAVVAQQIDLQAKTQNQVGTKSEPDAVIEPVLPEISLLTDETKPSGKTDVSASALQQLAGKGAVLSLDEKQAKTSTVLVQRPVQEHIGTSPEAPVPLTSQAELLSQKTQGAVNLTTKTEPSTATPAQVKLADAERTEPELGLTEPKMTVQAQSAAALTAPVQAQAKAQTAEAKVSTEELLKQAQTGQNPAANEQSGFSSSGESRQQTAEFTALLIETQKTNQPSGAEQSTFAGQLKSIQEKTTSLASPLTGREQLSEQVQKQADQLGQKLNLIQPEASTQLKERMLMMVKDKVHTAEIRLDPSELGSMQIKINLQQDQMSVQFMVQQGSAKELMEQQMPKLKELLQQQGIELSQGSVQQQSQSSAGQEGGRRSASAPGTAESQDGMDELPDAPLARSKQSDRVVDFYA